MRTLGRLIVVIAVFLVVAPAYAQTASNTRMFIDLALGADWDDARSSSTRAPGTTLAPGVAFGFDWGKSGLEIDVSVPVWHVHTRTQRYVYGGPSSGGLQQDHLYVDEL